MRTLYKFGYRIGYKIGIFLVKQIPMSFVIRYGKMKGLL